MTTTADGVVVTFLPGTYTCDLTPQNSVYPVSFSCEGTITLAGLSPRQNYTLHISGGSGNDLVQWTVSVRPASSSGGLMAVLGRVHSAERHVADALGSVLHGIKDLLPEGLVRALQLMAGFALVLVRRLFG